MNRIASLTFTTIKSEGALLPADFLAKLAAGGKVDGTSPEAYHLARNERLNEAISRAWSRCVAAWQGFEELRTQLETDKSETGTTQTREKWLLILFQELGYGRLVAERGGLAAGSQRFPISHRWGTVPIHLVTFKQGLDGRSTVETQVKRGPYSLLQEYLNASTDSLWGFVSNGLQLRILRDNATLTRRAFVEFDLETMMRGGLYADFGLLWMLCHQSRVEADDPHACWLEKWSHSAAEEGTRALADLRQGVARAIEALGGGFLRHRANHALRDRLRSRTLTPDGYYRQLLRLVYRLILLLVAEERNLLLLPTATPAARERYSAYYSIQRLRTLAQQRRGGPHPDLYHALRRLFQLLETGYPDLALPALGSALFRPAATPDLNTAELANSDLLAALRHLTVITSENTTRPVDYRNLGTEELGSVYEALLELHPQMNIEAGVFALDVTAGSARKQTGSYYTPASLISELLDSALEPVIEARLQSAGREKASQIAALLEIKVVDPACGSGHFLIAAAHRLATHLARIRSGEEEPGMDELRHALRDVVRHCIHGVDMNEMAVELCRFALWLETLEPGKPLSFLDANIQQGNSLVGVAPGTDISFVPDEAFTAVGDDDKATASALKKRNKQERESAKHNAFQVTMVFDDPTTFTQQWAHHRAMLATTPDDDAASVARKEQYYAASLQEPVFRQQKLEADLWTAAFFWQLSGDKSLNSTIVPTHQSLQRLRHQGMQTLPEGLIHEVNRLAKAHQFFHWELAFPTVFERSQVGFDVVLGNPPWERIKLLEREWFHSRDKNISTTENASERAKLIRKLEQRDPILYQEFLEANYYMDRVNKFIRLSNRFKYSAIGELNTYPLFAELFNIIDNELGASALICPTGLITEKNNSTLFQRLVSIQKISSVIDMVNTNGYFPEVDSNQRFALITFIKRSRTEKGFEAIFGQRTINKETRKKFVFISQNDLRIFSPDTETCPLFGNETDLRIAKYVYSEIGTLMEPVGYRKNPWNIKMYNMFHMKNDNHYFTSKPSFVGNRYIRLYEAKMINAFDHRFASSLPPTSGNKIRGKSESTSDEEYKNPNYFVDSRYYIPLEEVVKHRETKQYNWYLAIRALAGAVANIRTLVATIVPQSGSGNSLILIDCPINIGILSFLGLLGNLNGFVGDYFLRQKISGVNINQFALKQIPLLPPVTYDQLCQWAQGKSIGEWILPRVLELTYTAWDLEPFARDCGYEGPPFAWDEARRFQLRCELDAAFFHLYGIARDDVDYIMETFPIVKRKDEAAYGEYRTKRVILELYDDMTNA